MSAHKITFSRQQLNKGCIIAITLSVLAVIWILVDQFLFREVRCQNIMCPVNDYSYLLRILLVIALGTVAVWLLKTPAKDDSDA